MTQQRPRISLGRLFGRPADQVREPRAPDAPLGKRLSRFKCYDFELYVDQADRTVQPIVNDGRYEHHIFPVFLDLIKPGMRVLDIGANMGMYAVAAARKGARVTAIDASTDNCKLLALNAHLNKVAFEILPFAVSDKTGMALFPRTDDSNKTIRDYGLTPEQYDAFDAAFAAPLDMIIGPEKVDVVKIDIEGREYAALKDAHQLFAHRPIFFMEYAPIQCLHGSGVAGAELLKLFTSRGYTMTFLGIRIPNIELGSDVEAADRLAQQELDHGVTIIDLMFTP